MDFGMDFGDAIRLLKVGKCVARAGWNGKNMHLYLEDKFSFLVKGGVYASTARKYEPVICMFTAQGTHQPGWLASQADMLAHDWIVVTPQ